MMSVLLIIKKIRKITHLSTIRLSGDTTALEGHFILSQRSGFVAKEILDLAKIFINIRRSNEQSLL